MLESYGVLVYRGARLVAWSPLFETREEAHHWAAPWRGRAGLEVIARGLAPGGGGPARRGRPAAGAGLIRTSTDSGRPRG